jgi:hypothetical protein
MYLPSVRLGTVLIRFYTYLPTLREVYAKRTDIQWMEKATDESARCVADACGPEYEPQSETKKLGPWGSGWERETLTIDEWLHKCEEDRMDAMQRDLFVYDELDDELDDYRENSRDAAWDDTFDMLWASWRAAVSAAAPPFTSQIRNHNQGPKQSSSSSSETQGPVHIPYRIARTRSHKHCQIAIPSNNVSLYLKTMHPLREPGEMPCRISHCRIR